MHFETWLMVNIQRWMWLSEKNEQWVDDPISVPSFREISVSIVWCFDGHLVCFLLSDRTICPVWPAPVALRWSLQELVGKKIGPAPVVHTLSMGSGCEWICGFHVSLGNEATWNFEMGCCLLLVIMDVLGYFHVSSCRGGETKGSHLRQHVELSTGVSEPRCCLLVGAWSGWSERRMSGWCLGCESKPWKLRWNPK